MPNPKLLIVAQDAVGGAERISALLAKELPADRWDITFAAVDRNAATSIADFLPQGIRLLRVPNAGPLRMMWQLMRLVMQERPDVVFSSVMYLNTKLLPFSFLFPKTRFVVRCENYLYTFRPEQRRRIGFTYRRADAIIAQTQEMKDEVTQQLGISADKVVVLHNPLDRRTIDRRVAEGADPYPHDNRRRFVASGRFAWQKGFDILVRAFALTRAQRKDTVLYIVGDTTHSGGKFFDQVSALVKELGLTDVVHCMGYQSNPYVYVHYADCFVLSSRWEGLPNVLIESLYLGTPVAACKCIPVVSRLVDEGRTGYLAEKEDPESLAKAMLRALELGRIESRYQSATIDDFERVLLRR